MSTEVWTAELPSGFVKLTYTPGESEYPVVVTEVLRLPEEFDPSSAVHPRVPEPTVTPLLQGFDANFGAVGHPRDHHIRS